MAYWLTLILVLVGIGLIVIGHIDWDYDKHHFLWSYDEIFMLIGSFGIVIFGLIFAIMSFCLIGEYTTIDATIESNKETYKALTYKMESGACRDEFGLLSKEVIDEVEEWNTTLVHRQKMQNNFWWGIFTTDIWDEFETIDYETYNKE